MFLSCCSHHDKYTIDVTSTHRQNIYDFQSMICWFWLIIICSYTFTLRPSSNNKETSRQKQTTRYTQHIFVVMFIRWRHRMQCCHSCVFRRRWIIHKFLSIINWLRACRLYILNDCFRKWFSCSVIYCSRYEYDDELMWTVIICSNVDTRFW